MIAFPHLSLHIVSEEDLWHLHVPRNEWRRVYKIADPQVIAVGVNDVTESARNLRAIVFRHAVRQWREGVGDIVSEASDAAGGREVERYANDFL